MEQWIETALGVCDTWKNKLAKASSSDGDAEDFLAQQGEEWNAAVRKVFGSSARKAVLKVGNPTVRNRLLKSIVAIVDVTKRLPQAADTTGGPALALLQIQTELQRIESGLKRYRRRSMSATPAPGHKREKKQSARRRTGNEKADRDGAVDRESFQDISERQSAAAGSGGDGPAPKSRPPTRRGGKKRRTLPPPSKKRPLAGEENDASQIKGQRVEETDQPDPITKRGMDDGARTGHMEAVADQNEMPEVAAADVPMLADEEVELEASGPVITIDAEDLIEEIEDVEESIEAPPHDGDADERVTPRPLPDDSSSLDDEEDNAQTLDGISNSAAGDPAESSKQVPTGGGNDVGEMAMDAASDGEALAADEVEIHSVDLTDDSLLDQPVVPLKKRKEGSGLISVDMVDVPEDEPGSSESESAPESRGPERAILPEEVNRLAGQDARIALLETYLARLRTARALTQKQSAILEQVVTLLGSALPHDSNELARTLRDIDRLYRNEESPANLPKAALDTIEQRIRGLLDAMRQALHDATKAANMQGLDCAVGPVTALRDASDLPTCQLALQLVESMSRWRLPADLLYARGPASFFEIRIQANKSVALSWPIPENRLELGLIGDLEEIWIYALHLIAPSLDRPLGETATAGLPGAGVFYQISLPSDAGGASIDAARTFAVSETGRFLQALRRHVVRTA